MSVVIPKSRLRATPKRKGEVAVVAKLSDGAAALGEGTTAAPAASAASIAMVLTRHMLRDGELILLVLKPSRWYVVLSSLMFSAAISVFLCAVQLYSPPYTPIQYYIDAGLFFIACRVMWAVLNWMRRLYVLTDQRLLRLSGVFHIEVFDLPLRKIVATRLIRPFAERLFRLGSIEVDPADESGPGFSWQMINKPRQVQEQIEAAMRKARQGTRAG